MSTQGIEIDVTFAPPVPFTDGWMDAIYSSLESNMAIRSVDMFANEETNKISFLFGIDNFLDGDDFTEGVAREAIERAFEDAAGPNQPAKLNGVQAGRVEVFA